VHTRQQQIADRQITTNIVYFLFNPASVGETCRRNIPGGPAKTAMNEDPWLCDDQVCVNSQRKSSQVRRGLPVARLE
jgi:hypothetical protein